MNWLAHIFISNNAIDYQLGNLLADPLKGRSWRGASRQCVDGFKMHGSIDAFTDANPYVAASKSRLGRKGHLKGVIIDLAYDYCLTRHWERYSRIDIDLFMNTFYQNARVAIESYPAQARTFIQRVIGSGVLTSYGSFEGLETAFRRIDKRLPERLLARESTAEYLPVLKQAMTGIEQDFSRFFPQLIAFFKQACAAPLEDHWLR